MRQVTGCILNSLGSPATSFDCPPANHPVFDRWSTHSPGVCRDRSRRDRRRRIGSAGVRCSGQEVSSRRYPDYRGIKHCYGADPGQGGKPGLWRFRASTGDGRSGEQTLQVHARLADSPLSNDPGTPYVVGRPNHDAAIPPVAWRGRLAWEMQVNPQGTVNEVPVVTAEGVGLRLRDRAIAAGYLSLFFPDNGESAHRCSGDANCRSNRNRTGTMSIDQTASVGACRVARPRRQSSMQPRDNRPRFSSRYRAKLWSQLAITSRAPRRMPASASRSHCAMSRGDSGRE